MDAKAQETAQKHLDRVVEEGYTPRIVILSEKRGCAACGAVNKGKPPEEWTKFMFSIVGQRLDSKVYVYSFVLLCAETCFLSLEVHQSLRARMLEKYESLM